MLKSYAIGDDVLSQSSPSSLSLQPSYFLYDGHGSTRQLTDASGAVTAQYTYDSYGVMLGETAGAQARQATDLLYSGERFDPALQQYYLRARHYNQANGQFASLDPYSGNPHDPQSLHKYAYCHADPVNGVDPSGEMIFTLNEVMITSAIIGTLAGIVTYSFTGNAGKAFAVGLLAALITAAVMFTIAYWPQICEGIKMYLQRTAADRTVSNQLYKRLIETIGKDPTIAEKNLFYANYGSIRLFLEGLVGYGQKLWQLLNIFTASSAERAALIKWFTPTLFDGIIGGAIVTGITVWAILSNSEKDDD